VPKQFISGSSRKERISVKKEGDVDDLCKANINS
jgi:hypothetical protein